MSDNPTNRQEWIFNLLKVEKLKRGECYPKYTLIYPNLSFETYKNDWEVANKRIKEYRIKLNKAKEDKTISEELKGVESGVKIKIQRVLELQKQIESLELELEKDIMVVHTFSDGEIIVRERKLNALEKASLHKTIKEIRAEISKIEGDYAPIKNDMNLKGFTPQKIIFK